MRKGRRKKVVTKVRRITVCCSRNSHAPCEILMQGGSQTLMPGPARMRGCPSRRGDGRVGAVLRCGCREHVAGKLRVREARFRVLWWMPPLQSHSRLPHLNHFSACLLLQTALFFNMSGGRKFVSAVFHAPHICFFFLPRWFIYKYHKVRTYWPWNFLTRTTLPSAQETRLVRLYLQCIWHKSWENII